MAEWSIEKSGWINVYKDSGGICVSYSRPYSSKEEALRVLRSDRLEYIDTIEIKWKE